MEDEKDLPPADDTELAEEIDNLEETLEDTEPAQ